MPAALAMVTHTELLRAGAERLRAAGIDTARLDAEVLLAFALGVERAGLYTRLHAAAAADVTARFGAFVDRRARREPVAYITGVQEFWSLPFAVMPAVLIPRAETELLVEIVCRLMRAPLDSADESRSAGGRSGPSTRSGRTVDGLSDGSDFGGAGRTLESVSDGPDSVRPEPVDGRRRVICDIGTGSGCIAIALARELPAAHVVGLDISAAALRVAARNAAAHGVGDRVELVASDLFDGLDSDARFDIVVSNPPYLRPGDATSPELAREPPAALLAGADGLAVIRRLLAAAPTRLRPGGWVVMELGCGQDAAVRELAQAAGFTDVAVEADLAGIARVLLARATERGSA
jgi:release factor glutamine methyltransferase